MAKNFEDLISGDPSGEVNGRATTTPVVEPASPSPQDVINETYTEDEVKDVNNITVSIPDPVTPIVVFFGSPASGKTLTLLRLIRFLEQNNYHVVPEEVFRPLTDRHYVRMCHSLKDMAYSQYAPGGTDVISFMLVKVLNNIGQPVCQILEAPGEHYFDGSAELEFPTYINSIRTAPNRKVWVFFVEQGWGQDAAERNLYAQKICQMQGLISPNDKVVFLFNKADKHREQYNRNGTPNTGVFFTNIKNQYPGIFTRYANTTFLSKMLYGEYNFKALCFSSGVFTKTNDGREVWTPEKDWYCRELWNLIK